MGPMDRENGKINEHIMTQNNVIYEDLFQERRLFSENTFKTMFNLHFLRKEPLRRQSHSFESESISSEFCDQSKPGAKKCALILKAYLAFQTNASLFAKSESDFISHPASILHVIACTSQHFRGEFIRLRSPSWRVQS